MADRHELIEEIEGRWKALSSDLPAKLRQIPMRLGAKSRQVGIGIDPMGRRHLLLPHPGAEDQRSIFKVTSVRLDRVNLRGAKGASTWLDLHCTRPELDGVFSRVCADVIERMPSDVGKVESTCLAILNEWKALFGSGGAGDRMSLLIGVIGEMLLLRRLAEIDPVGALDAWEGPAGGRFDFRRASRAMEVKSTVARRGRVVEIHGHTQLEPPKGTILHLAFTRLERANRGSVSLRSLIPALASMGVDRDGIMVRLDDLGFDDPRSDEFGIEFEHLESQIYPVLAGFPRIVAESFMGGVPKGVVCINYTIDLDQSPQGPLDPGREKSVIKHLLKEGRETRRR